MVLLTAVQMRLQDWLGEDAATRRATSEVAAALVKLVAGALRRGEATDLEKVAAHDGETPD